MLSNFNKITISTILILSLLLISSTLFAAVKVQIPKHVKAEQEIGFIITSEDKTLQRGTLTITYRPGSMVESTRTLPVGAIKAGSEAIVKWTPTDPGLAKLEYSALIQDGENKAKEKATAMVGVLHPSTPAAGLIVMVIAFFVLFGGCVWAFRLLSMGDKQEN